jgi:signal transduction histidine kinase
MRATRDSDDPRSTAAAARRQERATGPDQAAVLDFQERERSRIGFDLHDGPAQTLAAALLQLKMVEGLDGEELRGGLAELRELMAKSLEETYELIERLRSKALDEENLRDKLEAVVRDFGAQTGIDATFDGEDPDVPLSPSLQIAAFRIVQEALCNVRRHSGAEHVSVVLRVSPETLTCTVDDDGQGFVGEELERASGARQCYGLVSMHERARFLDGECVVNSRPGRGTRIEVRIPIWRG